MKSSGIIKNILQADVESEETLFMATKYSKWLENGKYANVGHSNHGEHP